MDYKSIGCSPQIRYNLSQQHMGMRFARAKLKDLKSPLLRAITLVVQETFSFKMARQYARHKKETRGTIHAYVFTVLSGYKLLNSSNIRWYIR